MFYHVEEESHQIDHGSGIGQLKWLWIKHARSLLDFVDFDIASRGPLGSLLLLVRLRSRYVR